MRPKGFTDSFRGTWLLTQMIFDAVPQQVPQSTTIDIRRHDMLVLNVFYRLTKHTSLGLLLTEINTNYSDLRPFYYVTASNVRCRNDGPELALLQRQLDHGLVNIFLPRGSFRIRKKFSTTYAIVIYVFSRSFDENFRFLKPSIPFFIAHDEVNVHCSPAK